MQYVKHLIWNGQVTAVPCTDHSYAWSGRMPCTGVLRCTLCGKREEDDDEETEEK